MVTAEKNVLARAPIGAKPAKPETRTPGWNLRLNRALNLLLYLNFCILSGTGLLLWLRLPHRQGGPTRPEAFGLGRHEWGDLHSWLSVLFIALIVAHLVLHWKWLRTVAAKQHPALLWGGLMAGLAILLAFLLVPIG
jgi:uncharacterized BrkB/YihY/UPF0761 family membrane protein